MRVKLLPGQGQIPIPGGLALDDERWGAGAEADEGGFACAEDVSGEN